LRQVHWSNAVFQPSGNAGQAAVKISIVNLARRSHTVGRVAMFVGFACLVVSSECLARVYKWVDAEGHAHYGDMPPSDVNRQEIQIHKTPAVDPSVNTRKARTERLLDSFAAERQEKKAQRAARDDEKKKRKSACAAARKSHDDYKNSAFLYTKDDSGRRVILNDEEYDAAMAKSQADVDKWCD
jgi:hypothetical protein